MRRSLSMAVLAALSACGSPPVVHLHSLMPGDVVPAGGTPVRPADSTPLVIVLDPIRMPAQVDQPQWLVQLPDGSLASLEQERWASPLRDEFQQAVLETLIVRYGAVELRHLGNAARNSASALRIGIDVRRFDSIPGQEARIEGSWTIGSGSLNAPNAPAATHCEWFIRERAPGGPTALAQAHRRAVARLADGIGAALVAIKRNEPAKCPAVDSRG
ncbi:MAG: PqiC family protein [Caldimonas sp.]